MCKMCSSIYVWYSLKNVRPLLCNYMCKMFNKSTHCRVICHWFCCFFFLFGQLVFIDVLSVRIMLCIHVYTSSGVFGAIRVAIYNIVMMCHDVASFVCVCSMVDLKCGGSFTLGQNVLTWTWIVAEIVKCMFLCKWWDWFVMMNYLLKWRVWNEL